MKMLSTASSVMPSGRNASIIISIACARRGACDSTPPEPTSSPRSTRSTSEAPEPDCSNVSEMSRAVCRPFKPTASALCCSKDRRSASRQMACSMTRSSSVCGLVVGRFILFLMRFRSSTSSTGNGTQRRMLPMPASAMTFDTE
jgi:hypothetical protein